MPDRDWQMRVRCGGDVFAGAHGMRAPAAKVNQETGLIEPAEEAEYYSLYQGKRTTRQHCVSNPEADRLHGRGTSRQIRKKGGGPVIGVPARTTARGSASASIAGRWTPAISIPSRTRSR